MESQKSVDRCPRCGGVVFASKYSRKFIVAIPMFAYPLGLSIVLWTGHHFVDWMLLVAFLVVSCATFGLDALLPRSKGDPGRAEKWWRSPLVVSPVFVFAIAMYVFKDTDILRSVPAWLFLPIIIMVGGVSIALELVLQKGERKARTSQSL